MHKSETILGELKEMTPMLLTLNKNVYTIPDGYFNHFLAGLMDKIKLQPSWDKSNATYQVPEGYFDNFSASVIEKIQKEDNSSCYEELAQIAPLLNTINKKEVYSVPEGYFNDIEIVIPAVKKTLGKVISLGIARRMVSYAAAAVIAIVLVTGAVFFRTNSSSLDVSKELNKVSNAELNNYLDTAHSVSFLDEPTNLSQDVPNIQENLKLLNDQELQQYLDDNSLEDNLTQNKEGI